MSWNMHLLLYGLVSVNTKYQDISGLKLQEKFPRLKNLLKRYQDGNVKKRADRFQFAFFTILYCTLLLFSNNIKKITDLDMESRFFVSRSII